MSGRVIQGLGHHFLLHFLVVLLHLIRLYYQQIHLVRINPLHALKPVRHPQETTTALGLQLSWSGFSRSSRTLSSPRFSREVMFSLGVWSLLKCCVWWCIRWQSAYMSQPSPPSLLNDLWQRCCPFLLVWPKYLQESSETFVWELCCSGLPTFSAIEAGHSKCWRHLKTFTLLENAYLKVGS